MQPPPNVVPSPGANNPTANAPAVLDHRVQQTNSSASTGSTQHWLRTLKRHPISINMPVQDMEPWFDRFLLTWKEGNLDHIKSFLFASDFSLHEWHSALLANPTRVALLSSDPALFKAQFLMDHAPREVQGDAGRRGTHEWKG
jgi:hypothetical protein